MFQFRVLGLAVGASLMMCCAAMAGPDFIEPLSSDAGSLPLSAMPTSGPAPLKSISGRLAMPVEDGTAGPDLEDMFIVTITLPVRFCMRSVAINATTDCCGGAYFPHQGTNFNTQLWLFKADGRGLLANDDHGSPNPLGLSLVTALANDGSGAAVVAAGTYYIAISSGPQRDPVSAAGPIFNQGTLTEISGPDGLGGGQPITGWVGAGQTNVMYEITLCNVSPMPGIPTLSEWALITMMGLLGVAGAAMIAKRRKSIAVAQ